MSWIYKVQEAIEYIEANLFNDITIESIGKAINYAPSSFQNLFSAIVGYSIGEYIRFRRLSEVAEELSVGKSTVTETAF